LSFNLSEPDPFAFVSATWGFNEKSTKIGKHSVTLFDVGGGKGIRGYWSRYFHEVMFHMIAAD